MSVELDHFFILTAPRAPGVSRLLELGLEEGSANSHPGQGTANRRIFFRDTCLELLFVRDAEEAQNGPGASLKMVERTIDPTASPYGLVFRQTEETAARPFPGWTYSPDYFGPDYTFHIGENSNCFNEPMCILMPSGLPRRVPGNEPENPRWRVSEVRIDTPADRPSTVLEAVAGCDRLSVRFGRPHAMTVIFNSASAGDSVSLRPELPLRLSW